MCLGRFSAVTFQVLGHTKTFAILLISWIVLSEPMSTVKLLGMAVAVGGMIMYGFCKTPQTNPVPVSGKDLQPLLPATDRGPCNNV
eukprot:jgi/Chrzof1/2791/UNPLg00705.t1